MSNLGLCLVRLVRYEEAEAPLLEAYRRLRETNQLATDTGRHVTEALAEVCDHTGRSADAARWRSQLQAGPSTRK